MRPMRSAGTIRSVLTESSSSPWKRGTTTSPSPALSVGGPKIPACNKATLNLTVNTPEGTANVKYDLILWSSLEWKISAFFRAIGQKKNGEAFVPRWNQVVGAGGRAHFKPRKYTNKDGEERTVNDVASFYDAAQPLQQGFAVPQPPQQPAGAAWQGKF